MKTIIRKAEVKKGKIWIASNSSPVTDPGEVYKSLASDMAAKDIGKAAYIKSIKRSNNYDGTQNYTVTYDNNVRAVYTVDVY